MHDGRACRAGGQAGRVQSGHHVHRPAWPPAEPRESPKLVDKIVIERHPSKIDKDGRRHYLIRAIPYQDPQQEAERLKAVHEARVKIVPRV